MRTESPHPFALGIDIGGTFTDVVVRAPDGALHLTKVPTTRDDPGAAVRHVIGTVLKDWGIDKKAIGRFVHGTTVATNAVLERKGAKVGLLTTAGFRDVLEIGRQNRRAMYDLVLKPHTPVFLAPGALRKEVIETVSPEGKIDQPLDQESLERAVEELVAEGVEAIAICFLFSFANPAHEALAAEYIRQHHPDIAVSLSSEVDPTFREYERTCVTAFDAYVKPVLDRSLGGMERDLKEAGVPAPLQIMQSRGGICSSTIARRHPVRLFLSGPAAGVIGAREVAERLGIDDLVTIDIGGTSCDIAIIFKGKPIIRQEGIIDGYKVRVPMVDVNTIGSGGGSIAWLDGAGGLRVGPRSAGAEPGPACYGRGGEDPTVTDASVVLGYINPDYFADGALRLDAALARKAIEDVIAAPLKLTVEEAALGIHRVLNAQMAEAIRLVSISRGVDPRSFTLIALGGAGALHATVLAGELGIRRVIVPRHPGVLSAAGLLDAMVEHEASVSFLHVLEGLDVAAVGDVLDRLDVQCAELMRADGVDPDAAERLHFADVCYVGQAHHLEVPLRLGGAGDPLERLYRDFRDVHDRVYGHSTAGPAQIINLRAVHRAGGEAAPPEDHKPSGGKARKAERKVLAAGHAEYLDAAIYDRDALTPGSVIEGLAIIEQSDTTTLIEPGWRARVGKDGVLDLATGEK